MGYSNVARRLRLCGTLATVRTCNGCGDPFAQVTINAGCNVRACPFCARRESQERTRIVSAASDRVSNFVSVRAAAHLVALEARRVELASKRATPRNVEASRRVRRASAATRAQGRGLWGWKLVTISPRWDPSDATAYTVGALRARLDDVRERWRKLWAEGLGVEGLAGAYVRVELSSRGHVHLHALYFGPWQSKAWCARAAGCFVDIRQIEGEGGVREAVKYALKSPSPMRGGWVGGETATVTHPTLAARWVVATRSKRLAEPYGVMRDAVAAAQACEESDDASEAPTPKACASCGCSDLSDEHQVKTAEIARDLTARAGWSWHATDSPVRGRLPARVSIARPLPKHAPKM